MAAAVAARMEEAQVRNRNLINTLLILQRVAEALVVEVPGKA
jgi:hypothetical protein